MSYTEQLKKRNEYINKANKAMEIYIEIADDLFSEYCGQYAQCINIDVEESGINYHYYPDGYDYSKGTDDYFVPKEKIESLVEKYNKRKRKLKLKKLEK